MPTSYYEFTLKTFPFPESKKENKKTKPHHITTPPNHTKPTLLFLSSTNIIIYYICDIAQWPVGNNYKIMQQK